MTILAARFGIGGRTGKRVAMCHPMAPRVNMDVPEDMTVSVTQLDMSHYPFTECFEHCWLGTGNINGAPIILAHMYQAAEGGTHWRVIGFIKKSEIKPLLALLGDKAESENRDNSASTGIFVHMMYEASRLSEFLPRLYKLWKGHPDPSQNIQFDLGVKKSADGSWTHITDNKPAKPSERYELDDGANREDYTPNAGQTFIPWEENENVPFLPYTKLERPAPLLPDLKMQDTWKNDGWTVIFDGQQYLPGVTSEMLDWFWANMEKCYYLWAPGSHKLFYWMDSPAIVQVGGPMMMLHMWEDVPGGVNHRSLCLFHGKASQALLDFVVADHAEWEKAMTVLFVGS